jgi:putative ABC transport system permease protein
MSPLRQTFFRRRRNKESSESMKAGTSREHHELGNNTPIENGSREAWHWPNLGGAWADLKLVLFQLHKSPIFALATVSTLALGIGANTAIFSVINAVILKPLSYPDPGRIVQFMLKFPEGPRPGASIPDFNLWREQTRTFQDVSAYAFSSASLNLTGDFPEQVHGLRVTADYFRLFGAPVVSGRTFTTEEDSPNGSKVVVISHGLWKRKFGADPNIVGKVISLGNEPYTVLGVTGQRFQTDPPTDLWIPFQFDLNSSDRAHYFEVAGRLKPGIDLATANAELKLAANEALRSYPLADPELGFEADPLREAIVGNARSSLLVMGGAVSFVLLIACANVANLLLVRATRRKREFAIRVALGAGRGRILRQLLIESIVLSSVGGALGLAVGQLGVRTLLAINPQGIPRIGENGAAVGLDWRVLTFTLGVSLFTGLVFGLLPGLSVSRPALNGILQKSGNQQGVSSGQTKARSFLVISEISLSVVLLIGAVLLIRTFIALREVSPGFDAHNVLTMEMSLAGARFEKTADVSHLVSVARGRLDAIPGVQISAATFYPPLSSRFGLPFLVVGRPMGNSSNTGDGLWTNVSPGYFEVLRIPILRGRDFTAQDGASAPRVVIINNTMAKKYWPNQDPLGQQIVIGKGIGPNFEDVPRQIIGIVGDTRDADLSQAPDASMIIPQAQTPDGITALGLQFGPMFWLVRTHVEPRQAANRIIEQLREAGGGFPVGRVRSMEEVNLHSISQQNFNMLLLTIFATLAMVLAAVGIYGVMAYSTGQRTQEIGIRMALGASRANIRNVVLQQGMLLAMVGIVIGVTAALGLVHFIASFLFGVTTRDPVVFLSVPLLLGGVALFAVWLPARRATLVNPIQALHLD